MKRDPKLKSLILSVALSAFLVGCSGSSGTEDNNPDETHSKDTPDNLQPVKLVEGKAIDGYLVNSTVCLDLNNDGYCQPSEPMTTTDINGSFKLSITPDIQKDENFTKAMLLVYGGYDSDLGKGHDFAGKLLAPQDDKKINITPITTIVAKALQDELATFDKELSKEELDIKVQEKKEEVAKALGLNKDDIDKDPIKEKDTNPALIKETLKIQKAFEAISESDDKNRDLDKDDKIERYYEKLAKNINKRSSQEQNNSAEALIEETFKDHNDLQKVITITKNIDKLIDKNLDLDKVAFQTKQDIRKIAKQEDVVQVDVEEITNRSKDEWKKAYIKSDLEDIGMDSDITDEELEKISKDVDISRAGEFLDKIKKSDNKDDALIKEIKTKVTIKEEIKREKVAKKDALKSDKNLAFKEGEKLYWIELFEDGEHSIEVGEVLFEKNKIDFKDFDFVDGNFQEDKDAGDHDLYLVDGEWKKESNSISYTKNSDNTINIKQENLSVALVKETEINSFVLPELDLKIDLPKGSKEYMLRFTVLKDSYKVEDKVASKVTLDEFIKGYKNEFKIITVDGVKIAKSKNGDEFFTQIDNDIYEGGIREKGFVKIDTHYNKTTIDSIKKALVNSWESGIFEDKFAKNKPFSGISQKVKNEIADSKDEITKQDDELVDSKDKANSKKEDATNSKNETTKQDNNSSTTAQETKKDENIIVTDKFKSFDLSQPLYWAEADSEDLDIEYGEIKFVDGKLLFQDFDFDLDTGEFVKDDDHNEFILVDGKWIKEQNLTYKVNANDSLDIEPIGLNIGLIDEKVVTNIDFPILKNVIAYRTPVSKLYTLQFLQTKDRYTLKYKYDDTTLNDYIQSQCNTQQFMANSNMPCDLTTKEGLTQNNEKWKVTKVDGKEILIIDKGYKQKIFTNYNGSLYVGKFKPKGEVKVETNYNFGAIKSIKEGFRLLWDYDLLKKQKETKQESNQNNTTQDSQVEKRAKHTDIENDFIGSFIYFNESMAIAFYEEEAEVKLKDRKFSGAWKIEENFIIITDRETKESISYSFKDYVESPTMFKSGDKVAYKIVSIDKEVVIDRGEVTVDYIGF